jgi:hypothetical protein
MKLKIQYNNNSIIHKTSVEVIPSDYIQKIKELLVLQNNKITEFINDNNGPYNPEIKLSFNNIQLNNMFHINDYFIKDEETLQIYIEEKISGKNKNSENQDKSENKSLCCIKCGKEYPSEDYLKYHPGKLSAAEWVYGLTVLWEWSCCRQKVSTPDKCFHTMGCEYGICPDCRTECACYNAREIRREEEENF